MEYFSYLKPDSRNAYSKIPEYSATTQCSEKAANISASNELYACHAFSEMPNYIRESA